MRIYIVTSSLEDMHKIHYASEKKERAERYAKALQRITSWEYVDIEEIELDEIYSISRPFCDEFTTFISSAKKYETGGFTFEWDDENEEVDICNWRGYVLSVKSADDFALKSTYFGCCENIRICPVCGKPVTTGYVGKAGYHVEFCSDEELIEELSQWSGGSEVRKVGEHQYEWKPFNNTWKGADKWHPAEYRWRDNFVEAD